MGVKQTTTVAKKRAAKSRLAAKAKEIKLAETMALKVSIPKGTVAVVMQKPDVIEIIPIPKKVIKKQGWWAYLFGDFTPYEKSQAKFPWIK